MSLKAQLVITNSFKSELVITSLKAQLVIMSLKAQLVMKSLSCLNLIVHNKLFDVYIFSEHVLLAKMEVR